MNDHRQPLSTELLGFPPEARVLIINADDFGMSPSVNQAVLRSIEDGIAGSCSLMPPCPGAAAALELLRTRPHIPFGIHLTLVSDFPAHPWGPVSAAAQVPSLLDRAGRLFTPGTKAQLLAQARLRDVERELRAQLELVRASGLTPTHLDWHVLADGGRDDIFLLGLGLADEYGLAARVWLEPGRRIARSRGRPVVDHDFLDSFALDVDTKPARYRQLLRELPAGLSEWAVHPGLADAPSRAVDAGWRVRYSDLQFLVSAEAREVVQEEGIVLLDYRRLRDAR